jgi:hypothetical protein
MVRVSFGARSKSSLLHETRTDINAIAQSQLNFVIRDVIIINVLVEFLD